MAETSPRLYVGNLPYVAQQADIEALFTDNNVPFIKISISIDPFTGRNPSYCFVDFETQLDADRAMQVLQGKLVGNRPVRVSPKTERRDGTSPGSRLPPKTHDRGWRAKEAAKEAAPSADANQKPYAYDRWNRNDAPSRWTAPMEEGRRLYVGGLSEIQGQDVINAEMQTLFQGRPIEAVSKIISPNDYWKMKPGSHYYCFVDLASAEDAQSAMEALNGQPTPTGGQYKVSMARPRQDRPTKVMREQLGATGSDQGHPPESPKRDLQSSWRRAV